MQLQQLYDGNDNTINKYFSLLINNSSDYKFVTIIMPINFKT